MQDLRGEAIAKFALLPKYDCHKVVSAGVIKAIEVVDSLWKARAVMVSDASGADLEFICSASMFTRFEPKPGDYLVVYEDGYQSFSPKKAFDEGYKRQV